MKKVSVLMLMAAFLAVPSYGSKTIKMQNDQSVPYSMQILEDGFAGYSTGTVLSTFCLEKNTPFYVNSEYYAEITEAASSGYSPDDPISEETAYLYTMYMSGNQAFQNASMLQDAIHYLEDEVYTSTNDYAELALAAVANGEWSGIGDVRVVNLWENYENGVYSGDVQDQLVMINTVPAPGALLLTGLGTTLVGFIRRRK